jgi:hypothetical protein
MAASIMPRLKKKPEVLHDHAFDKVVAVGDVMIQGHIIQRGDWMRRDHPAVIAAPDSFRYAPRQLTKEFA